MEPQRASKSRFAGTEAEALEEQELGKAAPPQGVVLLRPQGVRLQEGGQEGGQEKGQRRVRRRARAVVALGGAPPRTPRAGTAAASGSSAGPPSAAGRRGDTPARAASAQAWIDASDFGKSGGGAADTPEGRAADAQKWIDAWKKGQ